MDLILILLFMAVILTYTTVYVVKGQGLWENIEVYTPNWSEKALIITFFYLFVLLIFISWYYNNTQLKNALVKKLNKIIFMILLVLFSFSIFCLSEGNTAIEEAFIISTIVLGLILVNMIISFMFINSSAKIFSLLPLALYTYLYAWIYEIKNNY